MQKDLEGYNGKTCSNHIKHFEPRNGGSATKIKHLKFEE